jgi:large subunit ribosomal protein L25
METMELKARIRQESGKGPARRLRSAGMIPAVFYGSGAEALSLSVSVRDLLKLLKEREESLFVKLMIEEGGKEAERLSMIKEIQVSPAAGGILHVDFYEIRMDHKLTIEVPIHLVGQPAGLIDGGELHHLKRELKISGLPSVLPEYVEVDVSGLKIGDSVKVGDISLAKGVEALDADEIAVAAVAAARATEVVAEAAEEAVAEPEVIGKKAEEDKE